MTLFSDEIQVKIADQEKAEAALSSVAVNAEILVLAEKAEHYLSEGVLTRDMVTDYVKEVKIYGIDDYRITWKYPELFGKQDRDWASSQSDTVITTASAGCNTAPSVRPGAAYSVYSFLSYERYYSSDFSFRFSCSTHNSETTLRNRFVCLVLITCPILAI